MKNNERINIPKILKTIYIQIDDEDEIPQDGQPKEEQGEKIQIEKQENKLIVESQSIEPQNKEELHQEVW